MRAKDDGSLWRLDAPDKYQTRYLVRISRQEGWASVDTTQLEKDLLIRNRGGLSAEVCRFRNCPNLAILESAFCVDHTYEMGVRE